MLVVMALAPAFMSAPRLQHLPQDVAVKTKSNIVMDYGNGRQDQYDAPNQFNRIGGSQGFDAFTGAAGFALVCLIGYAPFTPQMHTLTLLAGYHIGGMGVAFLVSEASKRQSDKYDLQTDGTHGLCRYPFYGGLVMTCVGVSLVSESPDRLAITVVLYLLLSYKAGLEDRQLERMYGDEYTYWAASAPRLLPELSDPHKIRMALSDQPYDQPYPNSPYGDRPMSPGYGNPPYVDQPYDNAAYEDRRYEQNQRLR